MIHDLLYNIDNSAEDTVLCIHGENQPVNHRHEFSTTIHQVSYSEFLKFGMSGFKTCFFDIPFFPLKLPKHRINSDQLMNRDCQQIIIWSFNLGFWSRKLVARTFISNDGKYLNRDFVNAYKAVLPNINKEWHITKSLYVYRFNRDALMLSESNKYLYRFENWSSNSKRNQFLGLLLKVQLFRVFVEKNWPFKILILERNSTQ